MKASGKSDRKGRDEAAAKNERHERYDKENQVESRNGREQQLEGQ